MSAPRSISPIDNVISELQQVIRWSVSAASRIGFFASLYLRVTQAIQSKIGSGYFDDDARMELLDATFAARYLTAVQQFHSEDPGLLGAWALALDATKRENLIVVQHLLLSMNAHINIDLAIAAARTCPGNSITGLQGDFNKINAILASEVPAVISEIGVLSPYLHLLADLAQDGETAIINFSLAAARDASWAMAQKLAVLPAAEQEKLIAAENIPITALGKSIQSPDLITSQILDLIRSAEVKNVVQIINVLDSGNVAGIQPVAPAISASVPAAMAAPHTAPSPAAAGKTAAASGKAANQVYYFEIAPGAWTGTFTFQITSWKRLWSSGMSFKNKLLGTGMQLFQRIFGDSSISSELTPHPERGESGIALNRIRLCKSWFTLWRSDEQYTLSRDGHRVQVDAQVNFGPIPFLFREHDKYPATVIDGGMRNFYHIKLLGTRFLGDYQVQADRRQVRSALTNDWAVAHETLNKSASA